jgi:arabinose-5-phosphate isomerase
MPSEFWRIPIHQQLQRRYNPAAHGGADATDLAVREDLMTSAAARSQLTEFEQLRWGREIVQHESRALADLAARLGREFCEAVELIHGCRGAVIVSGMGKAGHVGQKISATLASTGTRSHFLHPAEAVHGDLGRLHPDDVLVMLSASGETEEVLRVLPGALEFGVPLVAITSQPLSRLAQAAAVVLNLGPLEEACPNRLAPSTSTTAMMALGDALALVVSRMRGFSPADFARFHPGGSLGLKLAIVDDVMRPLTECRIAGDDQKVRDVFVAASRPGRRTGAIMLVDGAGKLSGLFTDSDLARLLEHRQDSAFDLAIGEVMNRAPTTTSSRMPLPDAVAILASRKFSELPVVDDEGRPAGMIDITDVVALLPREAREVGIPTKKKLAPMTLPFAKNDK